tara:strand:- start:570 stop:761 length:192 start_codon:yes stop_codon:yes gene_type:complete
MSSYIPRVGDLIRDKEWPEDMGIIVEVNPRSYTNRYRIISPRNLVDQWFSLDYVKDECEVVHE